MVAAHRLFDPELAVGALLELGLLDVPHEQVETIVELLVVVVLVARQAGVDLPAEQAYLLLAHLAFNLLAALAEILVALLALAPHFRVRWLIAGELELKCEWAVRRWAVDGLLVVSTKEVLQREVHELLQKLGLAELADGSVVYRVWTPFLRAFDRELALTETALHLFADAPPMKNVATEEEEVCLQVLQTEAALLNLLLDHLMVILKMPLQAFIIASGHFRGTTDGG